VWYVDRPSADESNTTVLKNLYADDALSHRGEQVWINFAVHRFKYS
jgi:hypothetical protein